MMIRLILICSSLSFIYADCDLEAKPSDFVIETIRLEIPGYPHAFNPSIVEWMGHILCSFRVILDPKTPFRSHLGLIWLDEHFQPIGSAQLLDTQQNNITVPSRAEDGRLLQVGNKLYFIYSNCINLPISKGGFRVHISEIEWDGESFYLKNEEPLLYFEGESSEKREKNWVPFNYQDNLFLSYSLDPHLVFYPIPGTNTCQTISSTPTLFEWPFGLLRGGTTALLDGDEYLSFFHTCKKMASIQSEGKEVLHYFMGAYRFSKDPPFTITHMSREPIIGERFYSGATYPPYWHPIQAIFPCGFICNDAHIWIAYGRQDHECWIVKLDKQGLMDSLE